MLIATPRAPWQSPSTPSRRRFAGRTAADPRTSDAASQPRQKIVDDAVRHHRPPPDPGRLAIGEPVVEDDRPGAVLGQPFARSPRSIVCACRCQLGRLTVVQSRVERDRNSNFLAARQGTRAGSRSRGFSCRADHCNWRASCCKARYFRLLHGYRLAVSCLVPFRAKQLAGRR